MRTEMGPMWLAFVLAAAWYMPAAAAVPAACPCIDAELPSTPGTAKLPGGKCLHSPTGAVLVGSTAVESACFLTRYGMGGCATHDDSGNPACRGGTNSTPGYCKQPWCYVDPTACQTSTVPYQKSDLFPAAQPLFGGNATTNTTSASAAATPAGLYYSYDTCGGSSAPWTEARALGLIRGKTFRVAVPAFQAATHYYVDPETREMITSGAPTLAQMRRPENLHGFWIDYFRMLADKGRPRPRRPLHSLRAHRPTHPTPVCRSADVRRCADAPMRRCADAPILRWAVLQEHPHGRSRAAPCLCHLCLYFAGRGNDAHRILRHRLEPPTNTQAPAARCARCAETHLLVLWRVCAPLGVWGWGAWPLHHHGRTQVTSGFSGQRRPGRQEPNTRASGRRACRMWRGGSLTSVSATIGPRSSASASCPGRRPASCRRPRMKTLS